MAELDVPLLVFARSARPGHTKTRLIPALGPDGAAELYAAFLSDTLAVANRALGSAVSGGSTVSAGSAVSAVETWVAAPEDLSAFSDGRLQEGTSIGERMSHALGDALARFPAALLIGSDAPTLPVAFLRAGVEALERADVVLGPSADGGYYLIGARGAAPDLRGDIRWSSPHTLADTVARLTPLRIALLPPWYDVDTPEDLRLLQLHLTLRPKAAPASAAVLQRFDRMRSA